MTVRVVQWATGAVGAPQLQELIDRPEYDLVGLFVYDPDKVGTDAGALVGRAPVGVLATGDKAAILAMDADVVIHAASKGHAENTNTDDIVALLESGKSVITTTTYNHLPTFGHDAATRIQAACARGGVRFHAAGENPGFMLERLAATLTGVSKRVDRITVKEYVDCSIVPSWEMLHDLMGMGKDPGEISPDNAMFHAVSLQYEQAIHAAAEVFGVTIDEVTRSIETATVDHDLELPVGVVRAGTVAGQMLTWTGSRAGVPFLVLEEYWILTAEFAQWELSMLDVPFIRVVIEGLPAMRLDLTLDHDQIVEGLPGSGAGHLLVAMTAVRAIPSVLASPPGIVTAPVFGAYRAAPGVRA